MPSGVVSPQLPLTQTGLLTAHEGQLAETPPLQLAPATDEALEDEMKEELDAPIDEVDDSVKLDADDAWLDAGDPEEVLEDDALLEEGEAFSVTPPPPPQALMSKASKANSKLHFIFPTQPPI